MSELARRTATGVRPAESRAAHTIQMTAEIAVINKSAIALAADSAVTIQTGTGQKIYNTVNKLFCLSRFHPVGVMVYGNANLNGVPWETLIKSYRTRLTPKPLDSIQEYAAEFLAFLQTKCRPLLAVGEADYFDCVARTYTEQLKDRFFIEVDKLAAKGTSFTRRDAITLLTKLLRADNKGFGRLKKLRSLRGITAESVVSRHHKSLADRLAKDFQSFPLTATHRRLIGSIVGHLIVRDRFDTSYSGLVIAGFGRLEHYPTLISFAVEGVVSGKIKYKLLHNHETSNQDNVMIMPFAQSEMVYTFMEGIDPNLGRLIERYLTLTLGEIPRTLFEELRKIGVKIPKRLDRSLSVSSGKLATAVIEKLRAYRLLYHSRPVVEMTAVLPKDELAVMAETLVNLTSFKRRVSLDAETVGGPIDVAVISKGDGFIWIKRKHYFKPELNPDFFAVRSSHAQKTFC
jgi:hypothetical protein